MVDQLKVGRWRNVDRGQMVPKTVFHGTTMGDSRLSLAGLLQTWAKIQPIIVEAAYRFPGHRQLIEQVQEMKCLPRLRPFANWNRGCILYGPGENVALLAKILLIHHSIVIDDEGHHTGRPIIRRIRSWDRQ